MLTNLYVKNLALIDEAEIEFTEGLNILSGETGAGKSIILGSVTLLLGGRYSPDMIGNFGDSALIEAGFRIDSQKEEELKKYDIYAEDGMITISRRIFAGKSIIKINGETTTLAQVKNITGNLIDIHGQHEHQSLLHKSAHLNIIDRYARNELKDIMEELSDLYRRYKAAKEYLLEFTMDEEERTRNSSFLKYEIEEIENAAIGPYEDVELEKKYRLITNLRQITEELDIIDDNFNRTSNNVTDIISKAIQGICRIAGFDDKLGTLHNELLDMESLINDFNRDFASYMESVEFDEKDFAETEKRLDLINSLKAKYGKNIEDINEYLVKAREKLKFYEEYELKCRNANDNYLEIEAELLKVCSKLTELRKKASGSLECDIKEALKDLGFAHIDFCVRFTRTEEPSVNGMDTAEFLISLNPGEDVKELSKIASGGELSRIMLGIKSILAGKDDIDSLIFDEIDSGISGRTAQKVSEKMALISRTHQVICITHLPQIASMADTHFLIEKKIMNQHSVTQIKRLNEEESVTELSRMLGGLAITDAVVNNAREMKQQASELKKMSV